MQELIVVSVENKILVLQDEKGTQYQLPLNENVQGRINRALASSQTERKVSPREVQSQIRAGMSPEEVATLTGSSVSYIERFVGPVLAEREHVLASAQTVEVHLTEHPNEDAPVTFGSVIRDRLAGLGASQEHWASWKDAELGWLVKLTFVAKSIEHDARWQFDPKKLTLVPLNTDATTLSQKGELSEGLIPRLRAVTVPTAEADEGRFDSGAFDVSMMQPPVDISAQTEKAGRSSRPSATVKPLSNTGHFGTGPLAAINRLDAPTHSEDHSQTADLLESLRKRRGERNNENTVPVADELGSAKGQPLSGTSEDSVPLPTGHSQDSTEVFLPAFDSMLSQAQQAEAELAIGDPEFGHQGDSASPSRQDENAAIGKETSAKGRVAKAGRAAMPSWDDIVFGAKGDE